MDQKNPIFEEDVKQCLSILKAGGVIIYPTDTIWGIGCDPVNTSAVEKIYSIKQREDSKSMIVLVSDFNMLERYVEQVPAVAYELMELSEKPLTIIFDKARNLSSKLVAADGSIGIRLVKDTFCLALLRVFRRPLVSTSANISGSGSPKNFQEIQKSLLEQADYVVRWRQGETKSSNPSSIIKLGNDGTVKIIRE